MKTPFNTRLFLVWLLLVGISLLYLWIDHAANRGGLLVARTWVTVLAICFALVKVRIIMQEFMEVRNAPTILCRLTDLWVVLMAMALLGVYLGGKAVA